MLLAYARLAEKHGMHLVSDEVYALSVFNNDREWTRVQHRKSEVTANEKSWLGLPNALPFTSMLNIDLEKELGSNFNKKRVHVIHGMSKDFCSNGLRSVVVWSARSEREVHRD
jgi:1-aminocyclopropane-1-carboxylate synthase